METLLEIKERINKAEKYFTNPNISEQDKQKYIPSYKRLIQKLSLLSSIYYSETIKQKFWFSDDGKLLTEDGVEYTNKELELLLTYNNPNIKDIHELKKHFKGSLLEIDDLSKPKGQMNLI